MPFTAVTSHPVLIVLAAIEPAIARSGSRDRFAENTFAEASISGPGKRPPTSSTGGRRPGEVGVAQAGDPDRVRGRHEVSRRCRGPSSWIRDAPKVQESLGTAIPPLVRIRGLSVTEADRRQCAPRIPDDVGRPRQFAYANEENLLRMFSISFDSVSEAGWAKTNPAVGVRAPKVKQLPTLPFSDDEMTAILAACDRYPGNVQRVKAFVLTMRYSGLRIGDTLALTRGRLKADKLFLYTQKTGTPVYVPLPPHAVAALKKLDGDRFFTTGNAKSQTARANWSRYLETIFELAKITDGHSHRFRDTFAVSLLEKGVSIDVVSVLLGHSSVRITERHYKPWVRALQVKLEEAVRLAWTA